MRRRFVYTITTFKGGKTNRYIVTQEQFKDRLAIQLGDTQIVAGWCGITSANYTKAESETRKMKAKNHCGLICNGISYRIFDTEEFERYNKNNEYALYLGDTCDL